MRILVLVQAAVLLACGGRSPPPAATTSSPESQHHPAQGTHHGAPHEAAAAPSCRELATTCHAHDKDSEKAHACHVLGHKAANEEECAARREECLTECGGARAPAK